jgi:hypothetical protein
MSATPMPINTMIAAMSPRLGGSQGHLIVSRS